MRNYVCIRSFPFHLYSKTSHKLLIEVQEMNDQTQQDHVPSGARPSGERSDSEVYVQLIIVIPNSV